MPYPILHPPARNNPFKFYVASDIKQKRFRRTKLEVTRIRDTIHEILESDNPQTVRQVFYALTVRGVITKAASLSFLHSAAKAIQAKGKPAHIYHFGDYDPSGVDAARDIEAKLRRYAPNSEIHFERPAVTRSQVEEWNLPTRPTKQTDTRAKKFGSATSVELDAIPARQLRALVRECIERHVDREKLALLRVAEQSEREFLVQWAATYGGTTTAS